MYSSLSFHRHIQFGNHHSVKVLVAQSCPTLCVPVDCSLPGSSVHGILQERILEWVAISFCRGSSQSRDRNRVFCIAGRFFTIWATRKAYNAVKVYSTQYVSKFGKLSSGHRTRKGWFSSQSQRRLMPKNVQTTARLHLFHMLSR